MGADGVGGTARGASRGEVTLSTWCCNWARYNAMRWCIAARFIHEKKNMDMAFMVQTSSLAPFG